MKASELRIGNYLDYYGQTVWVMELLRNDDAEFGYFTDSIGFKRKLTERHSPKPIPLTEEWLLKFGFEVEGVTGTFDKYIVWQYDGKDYCFMIHDDRDNLENKDFKVYSTPLANISFVHQLQNLYFALTEQELKHTL